jgi:hypothetical protein
MGYRDVLTQLPAMTNQDDLMPLLPQTGRRPAENNAPSTFMQMGHH